MRVTRVTSSLSLAAALAACGGTTTTDAGGTDAFAASPDAAATPGTDAGASAPMCPSPQTGSYTFEGAIPMTCPPGVGEFTHSVDVGFTPESCVVSFASSGASDWLLRVMGMAELSPTGTLGPTTISLNGVATTCSATYMEGSPQRFMFDCGDCDFTIRYGE